LKISKIILYDEPTVLEIQLEKLEKFLVDAFPIQIEIRDNFFRNLNDETYEKIASTRIFDIKKPFQKHNVSMEDISIEKENIDMSEKEEMALYDGIELHKVISEQIPKEENNADVLNIIFTNKLTCTFDENDFSACKAKTILS
jgi:hypothetical protein